MSRPAPIQPPPIRPGRDGDADGFIALIARCWANYPGCVMDVDGEMPELRALATYYAVPGGALWAAERDGAIVGMAAVRPGASGAREGGAWEVCRVYADPAHHGTDLGHRLLDAAEAHARAHGARRLVLWSDTRFDRAHRFYEKRGYVRAGGIRALDDLSNSLEYGYAKPLGACDVERLDAAAAESAERRLAAVLVACVDAGAAPGFWPPLDGGAARGVWRRVGRAVARGDAVLLAAWHAGTLAGTAVLDLDTPQDQPHRAEVARLLVHPEHHRRGLARALVERIEAEAAAAGRSLLTFEARAGGAAEALCRLSGWREGGRIPGYALDADGTAHDALFFWKGVRPSQ